MEPTPAPKSIFKSKTALLSAAVAAAGAFSSGAVLEFIQTNAQLILIAVGLSGIALRKITKGAVTLFGQ